MMKVSRAILPIVVFLIMGFGTAVNGTANDLSSATFDVLYKTEFGAVDVGTSQAIWQVADDKFSMRVDLSPKALQHYLQILRDL